jgi:hypothetical protein
MMGKSKRSALLPISSNGAPEKTTKFDMGHHLYHYIIRMV